MRSPLFDRSLSRVGTGLVLVAFLIVPVRATELLELPAKLADTRLAALAKVIDGLHRKALRGRKPWTEVELRGDVPSRALGLEARYVKIKDPSKRAAAFAQLALVYAALAWLEKIRPLEKAVAELDPELAKRLGTFRESEHFFVRVVGADAKYADAALRLAEAARSGYLELFGFPAISKVPGKKIRIVIHADAEVKPRLYFNPSPPYHGEIRFDMTSEKDLTLAGRKRLVYGFCHELGHMVAMWGKYRVKEDDMHAWAHYTGCMVVEEVYKRLGDEPWPGWTSFQRRGGVARLAGQIDGKKPGLESYESILALFHAVGDELGTTVYGKAWEWLETKKRFRRIKHVPYLWMKDLRDALGAVVPAEKRARVLELFGSR